MVHRKVTQKDKATEEIQHYITWLRLAMGNEISDFKKEPPINREVLRFILQL